MKVFHAIGFLLCGGYTAVALVPHRLHYRHHVTARSNNGSAKSIRALLGESEDMIGSVALIVPSDDDAMASEFGCKSPVARPSYHLVAEQLGRKIRQFSDGRVETRVVRAGQNEEDMASWASDANAAIGLGLRTADEVRFLSQTFRQRRIAHRGERLRCQFAVDCGGHEFAPLVGPFDAANPNAVLGALPWTDYASARRLCQQMQRLFRSHTSDEFALALVLFFHQFSPADIPWVQHSIDATWEKGPLRNAREIAAMATSCGSCIAKCLADPDCSACIAQLNKLDTRDQVNSYRTVVSFESDLLRDFSLCILQKNNVFNCDATIPTIPQVQPMASWRGQHLDWATARGILIGHLVHTPQSLHATLQLNVSWKVACGANVAYDQFPSQNQLFYPSPKGKDMWYDPVFRVETIDGRNVWCKRHYKVRNDRVPGTFRFSVLDNGVTSNEFWTIVDAADDLSWVVFHYAGAAAAVGQRYIGGLLCTPDGELPKPNQLERVWKAFRSAEIEPWELFVVDNDDTTQGAMEAGPPPLDYYRSKLTL